SIVANYQYVYRGVVQYYLLAQNVSVFWELHWTMQTSLLKTLAYKHRSHVRAMYRRYKSTIQTKEGYTLTCLEVKRERGEGKPPMITRFGGIALRRVDDAILNAKL